MASPVYFDTSVFLEISAKKSAHAKKIKALLRELNRDKVRIYTSILTVQEASVLSYRRGFLARDDYGKINDFARIFGINKEIALTAAKREAEIKDNSEADENSDKEENRRRKWDCFHIATAQCLGCSALYTTDEKLIKRQLQLNIKGMKFLRPAPMSGVLDFASHTGSPAGRTGTP